MSRGPAEACRVGFRSLPPLLDTALRAGAAPRLLLSSPPDFQHLAVVQHASIMG